MWVCFWDLNSVSLICVSLLCQYHAVLITIDLQYYLMSGRVLSPVLLFIFWITLAISGLLWFHVSLIWIICSSSMKNVIGSLIRIAWNLQFALGSVAILTILITSIQEYFVSSHFFESSSVSFVNDLEFSAYNYFTSLVRFIPKYFILGGCDFGSHWVFFTFPF